MQHERRHTQRCIGSLYLQCASPRRLCSMLLFLACLSVVILLVLIHASSSTHFFIHTSYKNIFQVVLKTQDDHDSPVRLESADRVATSYTWKSGLTDARIAKRNVTSAVTFPTLKSSTDSSLNTSLDMVFRYTVDSLMTNTSNSEDFIDRLENITVVQYATKKETVKLVTVSAQGVKNSSVKMVSITTPGPNVKKSAPKKSPCEESTHWEGELIKDGAPKWRCIDDERDALVYSAHYDDVESPVVIRIIALAREPLLYSQVWCSYYDQPDLLKVVHNVSGTLAHFRPPNGRKYLGAYVVCPMIKDFLPYAVAVEKANKIWTGGGNSSRSVFMIVHYSRSVVSNQTDTHENSQSLLDIREQTLSQTLGDNAVTQITEVEATKNASRDDKANIPTLSAAGKFNFTHNDQDSQMPKWNITRCFPAFFGGFNNHILVTEMVAISRVLGVDFFVFYVQSVGPNVERKLFKSNSVFEQALVKMGVAEVLPWNLHMYDGMMVHYFAQFSAIQDCLYRHLWSSRYILFGDADEQFVPRSSDSLPVLLDDHYAKHPLCGAFNFLNTFFNLDFPTAVPDLDKSVSSYVQRNKLTMLLHTKREKYVHPSWSRSKPAAKPERVLVGSVHGIQTFRKNYTLCSISPNDGLLHHYRKFALSPENRIMNDPRLWKYGESIVRETERILKVFEEM